MPLFTSKLSRRAGNCLLLSAILCFCCAAVSSLCAEDPNDFDSYKVKISAFWFYSTPTGDIQGSSENDLINLQKDFGFNNYSTISGKIDWKFTRKNHLYLAASPFRQERQRVLDRTIVYQGQTFDVGLTTDAKLQANFYAPGYQYDILRRRRGHLGVAVQMDLIDTSAKISAAAQVTGDGVAHQAVSASGSLLAPIPVAGPDYRLYLTNSPRVFIEGNLLGMYLFGYGNFVSTVDDIGVTLTKHLSLNAGYQLGSHLVVDNNSSSNRVGIHLTQKGAIVGLEAWF